MEPKVLIVGTDINAYYMARCYHEIYHKTVDLIGRVAMSFTSLSTITNVNIIPNLIEGDTFVNSLIEYAEKQNLNKDEKILLIGTNDCYVSLIAENKDALSKYYVFNYSSKELMDTLLVKETFYDIYKDSGLDFPCTYIYPCDGSGSIESVKAHFQNYPLIIKPSDGVTYHEIDGLAKVYKLYDEQQLEDTIKKIENAGYKGNLIIQEFIPGDDTALHDCLFYCGKDKKAKLATFAQIGLQEHTPTGIGNCTVLVNGYSEYGYPEELIYKLKDFLESIGYQGFAEFDLKYDIRDKKYKVFEVNPRQSRSGYYFCACGHNLVKLLIDDLFYNSLDNNKFELVKNNVVLSFVPKSVIKKYVTSDNLKAEIDRIGNIVRPLRYAEDMPFSRRKYLFMRDRNYVKKYRKYTF